MTLKDTSTVYRHNANCSLRRKTVEEDMSYVILYLCFAYRLFTWKGNASRSTTEKVFKHASSSTVMVFSGVVAVILPFENVICGWLDRANSAFVPSRSSTQKNFTGSAALTLRGVRRQPSSRRKINFRFIVLFDLLIRCLFYITVITVDGRVTYSCAWYRWPLPVHIR